MVRWTAPVSGTVQIAATFADFDQGGGSMTDVHVLHNGLTIFEGIITGIGSRAILPAPPIKVVAGDTVDFVVGFGDGDIVRDYNSLEATISFTGLNAGCHW